VPVGNLSHEDLQAEESECAEKSSPHSITSSAMASSDGGTVRPNIVAV
jgi:hypothetical protein